MSSRVHAEVANRPRHHAGDGYACGCGIGEHDLAPVPVAAMRLPVDVNPKLVVAAKMPHRVSPIARCYAASGQGRRQLRWRRRRLEGADRCRKPRRRSLPRADLRAVPASMAIRMIAACSFRKRAGVPRPSS